MPGYEPFLLCDFHVHTTWSDGRLSLGDTIDLYGRTGKFDVIVSTVSAPLDFSAYLSLLRTEGALVNVGAPEEPISVNLFGLIGGRKTLAGSMIGGIAETQEMLDFCAEHGLGAEIELINADQVNVAYDRVQSSDVRYRFVIDTATI